LYPQPKRTHWSAVDVKTERGSKTKCFPVAELTGKNSVSQNQFPASEVTSFERHSLIMVIATSVTNNANPAMERPAVAQLHGIRKKKFENNDIN